MQKSKRSPSFWTTSGICLLAAMALIFPPSTAPAAAVPDDLQAMYDVGHFQLLVPKLNAALAKTPSTDAADRYSLLLMKGEALLHLKASGGAQDAFKVAALLAPDDNTKAAVLGTADLIKHSALGKYTPKTKPAAGSPAPTPIDIVDQTSRKDAFAALLTDLLARITPRMTDVSDMTNLPSIVSLAKSVAEARDVEIAGTGADAQTKDLLDKLATQAGVVLTTALKPLDAQINAAEKDANTRQREMGRRAPKGEFGALSPEDTDELDAAINQATQVGNAAAQLQPIFGDASDLKTVEDDAQKIITNANKVLTEYHHSTE